MPSQVVEIKDRVEHRDSGLIATANRRINPSATIRREPAGLFWHISDLTVSYGEAIALSSVSIDIPQGSVTAIIGPSGCGKSSFLCCLNRLTDLIPGCCVSGRILMGPQDILKSGIDDTQLRRKVGLIFQKPNPFPLSIKRNLELPLREHGMRDQHEIDTVIEETLRATGLWKEVKDRLKSPAHQLSGGQQQRLCIARALALRPDALLMDEPCSALDPIAAGAIEELVLSLRERYTIVIVTHNLRQARRLGTDVAFFWMRDGAGTLIESGSASQIFDAPQKDLTKMYLQGVVA